MQELTSDQILASLLHMERWYPLDCYSSTYCVCTVVQLSMVTSRGDGYPLSAFSPPLSIHFLIFCSFLLFPFSFSHSLYLQYFFLLSIPFLSTRIVPHRFQAGGRRRCLNLGLLCFVHILCYLYCLVKIYSSVLLYLV